MKHHRALKHVIAQLFAVTVVLSEAVSAVGACNAPKYRRVRIWQDNTSDVGVDISIRLEDFAPERLICLARALRQKYPRRNVSASIFSSREAAMGYLPGSVDPSPRVVEYQSKLHGHYSYNEEKHEEYLLIRPDGLDRDVRSPLTTRIDLPATGTPICNLSINGRCLLEFQHIDCPSAEGETGVSGRVTLAGNIRRDGIVSDLAIVDAKTTPPERQSVLVKWAIQNLGTWRFEPAKHKDGIRITFYFDADLPLVGPVTNVQFRLPSEVRIGTGRTP